MNYFYTILKRFKKSLTVIVAISALLWSLPLFACGCGLVLIASDRSGWAYGEDSSEQSFIHFEKGIEKLIIELDIKNRDTSAVLVIPVPSAPDVVKADVLLEFPRVGGYNVTERARETITDIRDVLLATQLYPLLRFYIPNPQMSKSIGLTAPGAIPGSLGAVSGITVFQHLEKAGMITEVLSASTPDALYEYLTQKGLNVEKNSIPVFRDYISKDFSFVVSWINPKENNASARGVFMTFPAKKIFYPLKPGSAYAGSGLDKTVTIVGHVSPDIYSDIKSTTEVKYFYSEENTNDNSSLEGVFSSKTGFGFTKVIINSAPSQLTQDLYISNYAPLKILNAQAINLHPFLYGLVMMVLFSLLITFIISHFILSLPLTLVQVLKLSVFNWFTLIGTIVGSRRMLTEKRFKFVLLFSLSFVALVVCFWFVISYLYE